MTDPATVLGILVIFLLGILLGGGFFYLVYLIGRKASDDAMEGRGVGRRPRR